VLALSTSNRFLRTGERLRALADELETITVPEERAWRLVHVNRIEQQARLLLSALRSVYVALASFMSATMISILGAGLASRQLQAANSVLIGVALLVGLLGAVAIVSSSVNLFRATRLSMMNIANEAEIVRQREAYRRAGETPAAGAKGSSTGELRNELE
jgi:hypothetical protein